MGAKRLRAVRGQEARRVLEREVLCGDRGFCDEPCGDEREAIPFADGACIDDRLRACADLDETFCDLCEGSCPGQRCRPEVGCAPLSDVGGPCGRDADCRTDNCSLTHGVCRVPLEAACDATNCDICLTNDRGYSYCSRDCSFQASECPGGRCVGSVDDNFFYCRPACNDGCPGRCTATTSGDIRYCTDNFARGREPAPLLAPCQGDGGCVSDTCFSSTECDRRALMCRGDRGYCTSVCATDAQCGGGASCVEVPCADGAPPDTCGPLCLPSCQEDDDCATLAQAVCRALPGVGGEPQSVCDPRNGRGQDCQADWECASRNCIGGDCAPSDGLPNGTSCNRAEDCASGNCQGGRCRGTSLRGDPCETTDDCAAGSCVDGTCT